MAQLRVTQHKDGTVTVRVGHAVEHISPEGKTKAQFFDAVKWACISKDASISELRLTEILWNLRKA